MLVAEGLVHLQSRGRQRNLHAVAKGLVLDLVLAGAAVLDGRGRLCRTSVVPDDEVLVHAVPLLAAQPRAPRVRRAVKDFAGADRVGLPPPGDAEPAAVVVWLPIALLWRWRRRVRRRQRSPNLVGLVERRAAQRPAEQVAAVEDAVRAVLVGQRDFDEVGPRPYLAAALSPTQHLVDRDEVDAARHRAAVIASGRDDPVGADAAVRHAAVTVLPALMP